jgi:hypothetical protein
MEKIDQCTESTYFIGLYRDPFKLTTGALKTSNKVDLYEVKLNRETSLNHARSQQAISAAVTQNSAETVKLF